MLNLELAKYDLETRKFEKFLELARAKFGRRYYEVESSFRGFGDGFFLGKDFIYLPDDEAFYFVDEKDPLNRFNGLFDGRTFGNGKFVLILESMHGQENDGKIKKLDEVWHHPQQPGDPNYCNIIEMWNLEAKNFFDSIKLGNLHQNPELIQKLGNPELYEKNKIK